MFQWTWERDGESKNVFQRYMMVKKVMKGGHQGFEGALIDILHELSARLNFT